MSDSLENTRKMLCMRSWRRGVREMDLLLGAFADACLGKMDAAALSAYSELLERDDPSLYALLSAKKPIPNTDPHQGLLEEIQQFHNVR